MKVSLMALVAGFCLVVGFPLAAMAGPTPGGTDTDADGVENAFDNCSSSLNAAQKDVDHDGCGDVCDGDLAPVQGDGITGVPDFNAFRNAFGSTTGSPAYNPEADMNCDGTVGIPDFNLFRNEFGTAPGPSGISNSGRDPITCP